MMEHRNLSMEEFPQTVLLYATTYLLAHPSPFSYPRTHQKCAIGPEFFKFNLLLYPKFLSVRPTCALRVSDLPFRRITVP